VRRGGRLSHHRPALPDRHVDVERLVAALHAERRDRLRLQRRDRVQQLLRVGDRRAPMLTTTSPGRSPPALAGPLCSTPVISTPC
jgi:hypothetical protein